jgi:hypothetical protein
LLALCCLALASCAWVRPEPGAAEVRVVASGDVSGCRRLGTAHVEVTDRVLAVQRSPAKVQRELETLARNAAVEMGGNRIVASGPVREGKRAYAVFACP